MWLSGPTRARRGEVVLLREHLSGHGVGGVGEEPAHMMQLGLLAGGESCQCGGGAVRGPFWGRPGEYGSPR